MTLDLVGQRFNNLTVTGQHPLRTASKKVRWICLCDCGKETLAITQHLRNGNTKSCGCRRVEVTTQLGRITTHGMTKAVEYKAWQSMKDRCYNEDSANFPNYGGRGIMVWRDWMTSFARFFQDVGPRPSPRHSLDRIDNNGHYQPDNCRWATAEEQSNNKRTNVKYLVNGEEKSIAELAREYHIPPATLFCRLFRDNLSIEDALKKKASKRPLEYDGVTKRIHQWVDELGISYSKIYSHCVTKGLPLSQLVESVKRSN